MLTPVTTTAAGSSESGPAGGNVGAGDTPGAANSSAAASITSTDLNVTGGGEVGVSVPSSSSIRFILSSGAMSTSGSSGRRLNGRGASAGSSSMPTRSSDTGVSSETPAPTSAATASELSTNAGGSSAIAVTLVAGVGVASSGP